MPRKRTHGHIGELITLTPGETRTVVKIDEPGENLFILLFSVYYQMRWRILVDNKLLAYGRFNYIQPSFLNVYQDDAGEGIILSQYDTGADNYGVIITLPLKWETSFIITAENIDVGNQTTQVSVIYDMFAERPTSEAKLDIQQPNGMEVPVA